MNNDKISIEAVVNKLGQKDSPRSMSMQFVSFLAQKDDGLRIYYDADILGTEALSDLEPIFTRPANNEEPELDKLLIGNGTSAVMAGTKRLSQVFFPKIDGDYVLAINRFSIDGVEYYSCEETGMFLRHEYISLDDAYCLSKEVDEVCNRIDTRGLPPSNKLTRTEPGLRKAVALLAREKADESQTFRIGRKVNARALKNHILTLAKEHFLNDAYLKSIDDKLNEILDEFDLKETKAK